LPVLHKQSEKARPVSPIRELLTFVKGDEIYEDIFVTQDLCMHLDISSNWHTHISLPVLHKQSEKARPVSPIRELLTFVKGDEIYEDIVVTQDLCMYPNHLFLRISLDHRLDICRYDFAPQNSITELDGDGVTGLRLSNELQTI